MYAQTKVSEEHTLLFGIAFGLINDSKSHFNLPEVQFNHYRESAYP